MKHIINTVSHSDKGEGSSLLRDNYSKLLYVIPMLYFSVFVEGGGSSIQIQVCLYVITSNFSL